MYIYIKHEYTGFEGFMVRSGRFCTTYHHQNQRKSMKIPLIHDPETLRITGMSSWILLSCWKGLAIRWFTPRPHNQCTNHFINFYNPLYWALNYLNLYLWCPFWGEQVWKRGSKGLLLSIMLITALADKHRTQNEHINGLVVSTHLKNLQVNLKVLPK